MGSATAYQCDGPGCVVLVTRAPGTQYPSAWLRASFRLPGGEHETGAFHSKVCALKWLDANLQAEAVPTVAVPPPASVSTDGQASLNVDPPTSGPVKPKP